MFSNFTLHLYFVGCPEWLRSQKAAFSKVLKYFYFYFFFLKGDEVSSILVNVVRIFNFNLELVNHLGHTDSSRDLGPLKLLDASEGNVRASLNV